MGYRIRTNYAGNILTASLTGGNRIAEAEWLAERASFLVTIAPNFPPGAGLPDGDNAQLRQAYYDTYFQGVIDDTVFWEYLSMSLDRIIVVPVEVCELLINLRQQFINGDFNQPPQVRLITPTEHSVQVDSLTLGYS